MRKVKKYRKRTGTKKLRNQLCCILKFEDELSSLYYSNEQKNKN